MFGGLGIDLTNRLGVSGRVAVEPSLIGAVENVTCGRIRANDHVILLLMRYSDIRRGVRAAEALPYLIERLTGSI